MAHLPAPSDTRAAETYRKQISQEQGEVEIPGEGCCGCDLHLKPFVVSAEMAAFGLDALSCVLYGLCHADWHRV